MHDERTHGPESRPSRGQAQPVSRLDAGAFAERFRESYRVLWLIAVGVLVDRHLAEDAVQEAVLIGLNKLDSFEPGTNFTAWMGQIVRHVALNHRRKSNRRRALSLNQTDGPNPPQPEADPPVDMKPAINAKGELHQDTQHFDDQVLSALRSIGDVARACLLLRTIEGLDYKEISGILDIPPGTAMSHVYRTRQTLRQMLTDKTSNDMRSTSTRP